MSRVILREGDSGLVTHGTTGWPAGCGKAVRPGAGKPGGLLHRAQQSYRARSQLQGGVVPLLSAAGRACPEEEEDAFAIATRLVPGRSLE